MSNTSQTFVGSMPVETHQLSHPGIFEVSFTPGDFMSSLVATKSFEKGSIICPLDRFIPGERTRTSFQVSETEHLEFNTDLVFANHSCDPNMGLDVSSPNRDEWRVIALKDIKPGDAVTWFYSSTEWDAWGGGFACSCGTAKCTGIYRGAIVVPRQKLREYKYINPHIYSLALKRDMHRKNLAVA